jgi:hypothetical protein
MGRSRRPLIPEARDALNQLKVEVMRKQGYPVENRHPELVKNEVANELGIPLHQYNGDLKAKDAGRIGGEIGGSMVKEMIRMALKSLKK